MSNKIEPVDRNRQGRKNSDVVLINMPFGLLLPSLGLSLLKAGLAEQKIDSEIYYYNLSFAKLIGHESYQEISQGLSPLELAGEWLFSPALFGKTHNQVGAYQTIHRHSRVPGLPPPPEKLIIKKLQAARQIRRLISGFLDRCLEEVLSLNPKIVGFSSMFEQHSASLALARLVKTANPRIFIIFGGANCQEVMGAESIRQFDFIDAVVSGEGDMVFPQLVAALLNQAKCCSFPGVYTRDTVSKIFSHKKFPNAPQVRDLDALPFPDYDDFFNQLEDRGPSPIEGLRLLFETSRGCWWAMKKQCLFCGLNGRELSFRSKTARRAQRELFYLADKYPGYPLAAADNILNMDYFNDLIPALAASGKTLDIFYQVKSSLTKNQLEMLKDAGIRNIQPGIESLDSRILKLMHKGGNALQNIKLLKWCKEMRMEPAWNIVWRIPGEKSHHIAHIAGLIPHLLHLPSPLSAPPVNLVRFSPLFESAKEYGLTKVKPAAAYEHIYPLTNEAIKNLAYRFDYESPSSKNREKRLPAFFEKIAAWIHNDGEFEFFWVDENANLYLWDERPDARNPLTVLSGYQRELFILCSQGLSALRIKQKLKSGDSRNITLSAIRKTLDNWAARGFLVKEGDKYLSLALSAKEYSPGQASWARFKEWVSRRNNQTSQESGKSVIKLRELPAEQKIDSEELNFLWRAEKK